MALIESKQPSEVKVVTKVIIPVAGLGTRFLPASKSIPKEMVTIVDKPAIHYVVNEAIAAGAKTIILVTNSSKDCIENYFDRNNELENALKSKGKYDLLDEVNKIIPDYVSVVSVRQHSPSGLGNAVLCAKDIVGNEPFMVMLPDMLINSTSPMVNMVKSFKENGYPTIMVNEVPKEKINQYGIIESKSPKVPNSVMGVFSIVEKPELNSIDSNLAIVGRYVFPSSIMKHLQRIKPDASGEYQLTDAIKLLRNDVYINAFLIEKDKKVFDCGDKLGYLDAVLNIGLDHPKLGDEFKNLIKKLDLN